MTWVTGEGKPRDSPASGRGLPEQPFTGALVAHPSPLRYDDTIMAGDYIGMEITITFKCKNAHSSVVKWAVLPQGDNPTARLIVEQEAFKRAFASEHVCPCGASIDGDPKVSWK